MNEVGLKQTKSADADKNDAHVTMGHFSAIQNCRRRHRRHRRPDINLNVVVVDDDDDYEDTHIVNDDNTDTDFDELTSTIADTSCLSSSSSSSCASTCYSSSRNSHATERTANANTTTNTTTSNHQHQHHYQHASPTTNPATAAIATTAKATTSAPTTSTSTSMAAATLAVHQKNHHQRQFMTTKVHNACCNEFLHTFLIKCFNNLCYETTTSTEDMEEEEDDNGALCNWDAIEIELLTCVDLCYDDDIDEYHPNSDNNDTSMEDEEEEVDDDEEEIYEKRKQWRTAKKKQLLLLQEHHHNPSTNEMMTTMTTTKKSKKKSPIRPLFNATWYGGNTKETTALLAPQLSAATTTTTISTTTMETTNETGVVAPPAAAAAAAAVALVGVLGCSGGIDSPIVTATTPREDRDGNVPWMVKEKENDTKIETATTNTTSSSPNNVMMMMMTPTPKSTTTMTMTNNPTTTSHEDNNDTNHDKNSIGMRYYSGLSSVARELLRSIADEKTLPLLLDDCNPLHTTPSITTPTTTTGGDEGNASTAIDNLLHCGKEGPVFSPPKVRRFPNMIGVDNLIPDEDYAEEFVDAYCVSCKTAATTTTTTTTTTTDATTDREDHGLPTTLVVPSEEIMISLSSLPLDYFAATATAAASAANNNNLPSSPFHQKEPGCHLMPSWLQQLDNDENSDVLNNGIIVHVAQKVNGAFQCCHSGNGDYDYDDDDDEENVCVKHKTNEIMDRNTILATEHGNGADDAMNKDISNATAEVGKEQVEENEENMLGIDDLLDVVEDVRGVRVDGATKSNCTTVGTEKVQREGVETENVKNAFSCRIDKEAALSRDTITWDEANKENDNLQAPENVRDTENLLVEVSTKTTCVAIDEGKNTYTSAQYKDSNDGSWKQRRQMYRKLGEQARKRHYLRRATAMGGSSLAVTKI
jgi:hypothetical protein